MGDDSGSDWDSMSMAVPVPQARKFQLNVLTVEHF